jgi:hypothetical protein
MRNPRERSSAEREERSEHEAPARKSVTPESQVLAARGVSFDGLGNRVLLSLLRSGRLQRKARISQQGDPHEHAADRAADDVVSGERSAHDNSPPEEVEPKPTKDKVPVDGLGPVAKGEDASEFPQPSARETRAADLVGQLSGGHHLDNDTRELMESRFGEDFSDVRIHTDHRAAEIADTLDARAFTVGEDVVFAEGEFAPETTEGQRLLAHELAHVIQQRRATGEVGSELSAERDALKAAADLAGGGSPTVTERVAYGRVQCLEPKLVETTYEEFAAAQELGPTPEAQKESSNAPVWVAIDVPIDEDLLKAHDIDRALSIRFFDLAFRRVGINADWGIIEALLDRTGWRADYKSDRRKEIEANLDAGKRTYSYHARDFPSMVEKYYQILEERRKRLIDIYEELKKVHAAEDFIRDWYAAHVNVIVDTANMILDIPTNPFNLFQKLLGGKEFHVQIPHIDYVGDWGRKYGHTAEAGGVVGIMIAAPATGLGKGLSTLALRAPTLVTLGVTTGIGRMGLHLYESGSRLSQGVIRNPDGTTRPQTEDERARLAEGVLVDVVGLGLMAKGLMEEGTGTLPGEGASKTPPSGISMRLVSFDPVTGETPSLGPASRGTLEVIDVFRDGRRFSGVINRDTGDGFLMDHESGVRVYFENGQEVGWDTTGPSASASTPGETPLLPGPAVPKTGGGLTIDPFTQPGGTIDVPLMQGTGTPTQQVLSSSEPAPPVMNPRLEERLTRYRAYRAAGRTMDLPQWVERTDWREWGANPTTGYTKWDERIQALWAERVGAGTGSGNISLYGKSAEGPALQAVDPSAQSTTENFPGYDGYNDSSALVEYQLQWEQYEGEWIQVVQKKIRGGIWYPIKTLLSDVATEALVRDNVHQALTDVYNEETFKQRLPARDPTPIAPNTYLRIVKDGPADGICIIIQVPGEVTPQMQTWAENAVGSWRKGLSSSLPPLKVVVRPRPTSPLTSP